MYARSTTIVADPSVVDEGIAFIREEVWPFLRDMDGCLGISMLVDRESGRSIVTSSWRSAEAMQSSSGAVVPLREHGAQMMGGSIPAVDEWEIASMHRAHHSEPGTFVRVAWSQVAPRLVEGAIDFYKYVLLPDVEQMDGFVSASLMIDRARGRGVTSVAFESREAMESTRDKADYLRGTSTQEAQVEFLDVAEFELVFAHLHVPEVV